MLDTVWRLAEKDFDVDEFLKMFGLQEVEMVFHQGEERRRGKAHGKSGFNITVSENLNSEKHIGEVNEFIIKNKDAFDYLAKHQINNVLDIGCSVGTVEQFSKSINVPPRLLGLLNRLNISLEFSAYPASDEDNET